MSSKVRWGTEAGAGAPGRRLRRQAREATSLTSPPGYNIETMATIGNELRDYLLPFTQHETELFDNGETEIPALKYVNMSIEAQRSDPGRPQLAARFGISSIPALMVFKDGKVVDQLIGAAPKPQIQQLIEKHVG